MNGGERWRTDLDLNHLISFLTDTFFSFKIFIYNNTPFKFYISSTLTD